METVEILVSTLLIGGLLLSLYFLFRLSFVGPLGHRLINLVYRRLRKEIHSGESLKIHDWDEYSESKYEEYSGDKIFNKMLFSFKPLKLKNFFTEEQIHWIKYGDRD